MKTGPHPSDLDARPVGERRRQRKTALDKAIENLDAKIAAMRDELKAHELARQHLVNANTRIHHDPETRPAD
jgi:DNA-binding protein H-NS